VELGRQHGADGADVSAPVIPPRPAQLHDAARLANAALEQLVAAIEATENEDLGLQLNEAADELESAIGYMTAVPEIEYLGQHIRRGES
jgi:hypothetical protein